jgi:hypothetical protein
MKYQIKKYMIRVGQRMAINVSLFSVSCTTKISYNKRRHRCRNKDEAIQKFRLEVTAPEEMLELGWVQGWGCIMRRGWDVWGWG